MLRPLQWGAAPLPEVSSLLKIFLLSLTVDGVPCSALDDSVVPPPKRLRGDENKGQCPGSLVPYFVPLLDADVLLTLHRL